MSPLLIRVVRTGLVALIFTSLAAAQVGAAPRPRVRTDRQTTDDIAAARAVYEKAMDDVRKSVRAELDRRLRMARNLKEPNLAAINDLNRQREAFVDSGQWPSAFEGDSDRELDRGEAGDAATDFMSALKRAKGDCEQSGATERELEIARMIEEFGDQSDLNEWVPVQTASGPGTLKKDGTLMATIPFTDSFRLDMQAKQVGDNGSLVVDMTLDDGSTFRFDPAPRDKGIARTMVSVKEGRVTADCGTRVMTADASAAHPGARSTITFRVVGGEFKGLSVRAKRIVKGKPESVSARKIRDERAKATDDGVHARLDAARPNLSGQWRGRIQTPGGVADVAVSVDQRNENFFIVNVDLPGTGGHELIFHRNGTLCPDGLRANGGRGGVFLNERGTLRVKGDTMVIEYSAFAPGQGMKRFRVEVRRL